MALDAAREVSGPLLSAFRSPHADLEVSTKASSHDVVTYHDRHTEVELIGLLTQAVPGSAVIGEETGVHPAANTATAAEAVEWIIDPVDGTSNFAHGFAMFSISIAAAVDGTVRAGVVVDPVNALEFSADDDGALLNGEPLVPRPAPRVESAMNLVTSFPSAEWLQRADTEHRHRSLDFFGQLVDTYSTVRRTVSGALELCFTAAGWADLTITVATHPWDIAAGQLILRRAGGTLVTGAQYDQPHLAPHCLGVAPGRTAPRAEELFVGLCADPEPEPTRKWSEWGNHVVDVRTP